MNDNTAAVWFAAIILISVFIFAGEQDIQDALINYIVDASGGR